MLQNIKITNIRSGNLEHQVILTNEASMIYSISFRCNVVKMRAMIPYRNEIGRVIIKILTGL